MPINILPKYVIGIYLKNFQYLFHMKGWDDMTSEELKLVDSMNQQYKALLVMQGKAYKKILNFYNEYISDLKEIKIMDESLAVIEATIITELEHIKKQTKLMSNN